MLFTFNGTLTVKVQITRYVFRTENNSSDVTHSCTNPEGEGGRGSGPSSAKSQNIGVLSNTGTDPLKITKLPDGPLLVLFGSSSKTKTKKKNK